MLDLEVKISVYCPDEREAEIKEILQRAAYYACNVLENDITHRTTDNIDISCTEVKRS